jgi:hypothetical protein
MKHQYTKITAGLIVAWFTLATSASALNLFRNNSDRLALPIAVAALAPVLVFSVWFSVSPKFRQFVLSLRRHGQADQA